MRSINLKKIPKRRLAEMWCELNSFNVPKELKKIITTANTENNPQGWEWMEKILELVHLDECLMVWREIQGMPMKGDRVIK